MDVKLLAFNRLEILFPSHYATCPWSSLNYLPVFTGLLLPFMSSLTFSGFTNCCQERGWSFSSINQMTGEDLEISGETALLWILSIQRSGRELHLFQLLLKFLSGVFSLRTIKLEKREPNNPTGNEDDCLRVDLTWSKAHISKACWTYQTFQLVRLETTEDLEQQSEDLEEHSAADSVVYNADHLPIGEGISCNRNKWIHSLF